MTLLAGLRDGHQPPGTRHVVADQHGASGEPEAACSPGTRLRAPLYLACRVGEFWRCREPGCAERWQVLSVGEEVTHP